MRLAVTQAVHHATHRYAFGRRLIDQPLMRNVLADMAIESEAATMLSMRLARAFDGQKDESETLLRRLLTPAVKYWICKRGPCLAAEAMEVLGGNGYVEDGPMPRIYREMPLNSIWEGSGNIMCLDMLRAFARTPEAVEILFAELEAVKGSDARLDRFVARLRDTTSHPVDFEAQARRITEHVALALQGALLVRYAPQAVVDAFCASRLDDDWGCAFGTLPAGAGLAAIVARSWTEN
jgi:putative acyl-CoA dehydrogenase